MRKAILRSAILPSVTIIVVVLIVWAGNFYWQNLRGSWPAFGPPKGDIAASINATGMPLTLPPGFAIEIFAKNLPGARVMAQDIFGNWWVSQTGEGKVSLLEIVNDGVVNQREVFKGLRKPHGLTFDPKNPSMLYVAEEDKISRVEIKPRTPTDPLEKIADLPAGGGHFTRTIAFGPDGRLYVSIGSSCNVCNESDPRRAAIYSMNPDGSDFRSLARGLRNAVFFDWSYVDGRMWATDNGRDLLGDDVPPDEINIIRDGGNYGWPTCYGKNIHDTDFDKNTYVRNPCMEPFEIPSHVDIQAHSAPLGLAFIPEEGWPEEYWHDLVVALHGSWNRTVPTGYKLIRIKLDANGNYEGTEDFITGWLQNPRPGGGDVFGRPVQVIARPGGTMYVTDDKAGVIYRITYDPKKRAAISNFEECVAAGHPVVESYPRRCAVPGGGSFSEYIGNELDKLDVIRLKSPRPNSIIASPLVVEGEARGNWFFEASFPVELLDANGKKIPLRPPYIMAEGEWMTTNFVPFRAVLEFDMPATNMGTLILQKDNPSGLQEHSDSLIVPVYFGPEKINSVHEPGVGGKRPSEGVCRPTGCSGEICADKDAPQFSICLWKEEYACYKNARCERQPTGECGWTPTPELIDCFNNASIKQ